MVGSYSEGYTHGVRSKPTAAITADTPTSAANKIRRNYTSAVRLITVTVCQAFIMNSDERGSQTSQKKRASGC